MEATKAVVWEEMDEAAGLARSHVDDMQLIEHEKLIMSESERVKMERAIKRAEEALSEVAEILTSNEKENKE